jgi:hypothetical protein
MSKVKTLAKIEGITIEDMIKRSTFDSVAPGICSNPGCNYTTEVEPDQSHGYCEVCGTQTVTSCLVLMGMI